MNAVSGLFKGHHVPPQLSKRQLDFSADQLAEQMELGLTVNEASDVMGITRGTGCVLWRRICLGLGEAVQ